MKTFTELNEDVIIAQLEEEFLQLDERSAGLEFGDLLPAKLLSIIKRALHKKQYIQALKIAKNIMKDPKRDVSKSQALIKAAQIVGIDSREFMQVLKKNTKK